MGIAELTAPIPGTIVSSGAVVAPGGAQGPPGGTPVWGEVPTGSINGTNKNFSVASPYVSGLLAVYLNGLRQSKPNDYSETGSSSFQMVNAPLSGDSLMIDYFKA